jgi:CRISPR-associated endonuclease/helicase Cas3
MNILLVSQCDKRALTESRRILDQFAERRGDRTWQTPITQDGLDTLRRLLRATARKNTAVACHWLHGADRSELLWVVGDRRRFNDQGATPTNATQRDVLRQQDENDWHSGDLIQRLADLAGLLHDLGKSIAAFQRRLVGQLDGVNLIRHEWVSLRLFAAFVGDDDDATWLARLGGPEAGDPARWLAPGRLLRDGLDGAFGSPFQALQQAPLAQAVGWLVVTHHRLPQLPDPKAFQVELLNGVLANSLTPAWNERAYSDAQAAEFKPYWQFQHGLPVSNPAWQQRAARVAKALLQHSTGTGAVSALANPFVMHLSRLCLMLADHHYSGLTDPKSAERVKVDASNALLANTKNGNQPNQSLDEHLLGVAQHAAEIARFLPRFEQNLPRLGRHRLLKQRAQSERFRWQDKAADLAIGLRDRSQQQGAFIVNMASTGCGKTLANARVMYALADPALGMRCAFALGLRTLTLQTGRAFRQLLQLGDDDLAVRVGGSASRALFEHYEALAEASGSASSQALLEEDSHVLYEGQQDRHPLLRRAVADPQVRNLLTAPLLVCTIDHLTPATESQRGGRQIAPMLRLLSGDLVLDEPDDFDLADLPALTRLVHWAGLLGARVLLSSATLPPALVQGLFEAYRNGRQHFQRNRGARPGGADTPPAVCCAWVDEFRQAQADCAGPEAFEQSHLKFAEARQSALARLAADEPRRRAVLIPLPRPPKPPRDWAEAAQHFAPLVLQAGSALHRQHHGIDPSSGKRVSFGLVRMANIEPLFEVALALYRLGAPAGLRIHLCVYHSQFPLLIRSAIERQLDDCLQRQQPEAVYTLPDIRARLDASPEPDQLFIVLGSPVTEVGRDHDYDWAVVEPSSMRSLIQLAGRVRRHRPGGAKSPNMQVFASNLRHWRQPGEAAFRWPGFEDDAPFRLQTHDLNQLLAAADYAVIDARPRIVSRPAAELRPQQHWVDLEHGRMRQTMLALNQTPAPAASSGGRVRRSDQSPPRPVFNASTWWHAAPADALLTAVIPQKQRFRDSRPDLDLVLLPDEDGEKALLHRIEDWRDRRPGQSLYTLVQHDEHRPLDDALVLGERIQPWGVTDYLQALAALADEMESSLMDTARRFGTVNVAAPREGEPTGWRSHPALGFVKRR